MFPSNTFPIKSADLFSASAQLGAAVSEVQQSLWSSKGKMKILHLLKSGVCSPPPAFPAAPKGEGMRVNVSSQPAPPGWGSPEAPVAGDRGTEPESLSGSSSVLGWGGTRGGKGHWPELLLDTEGRRGEPRAGSFAVTHRFCPGHPHIGSVAPGAVPVCRGLDTWAETSFLLPPATGCSGLQR